MIDPKIAELFHVRLDPEKGESTHSYLHRLSDANGYRAPLQMLEHLGIDVGATTDLDLVFEEVFFECLTKKMGYIDAQPIRETSLSTLEGSVVPEFPRRTYHRWVLSRGYSGNGYGSNASYMVCPFCVQSAAVPHWKAEWRLSLATTCSIHKTDLWDCCPSCKEPFALQSLKRVNFSECPACNAPIKATKRDYDKPLRTWLTDLAEAAGNLTAAQLPVDVAFEYQWWEGVSFLVGIVTNPKYTPKLAACESPHHIRLILTRLAKNSRKDFNAMGILDRRDALRVVAWLLGEWPARIVNVFGEAGVLSSATMGFDRDPCYWVHRVFREHLAHKKYSAGADEIEAAIHALKKYNVRVTKNSVRLALGINESKVLDRQFPKRRKFKHSDLRKVVTEFAKEIEEAPPLRDERFCAVRDAVAICVSAAIGIKPEYLIQLDSDLVHHALNKSLEQKVKSALIVWPHLDDWLTEYEKGAKERNCRVPGASPFLVGRYGPAERLHGIRTRFARVMRSSGYLNWSAGFKALQDLKVKGEQVIELAA